MKILSVFHKIIYLVIVFSPYTVSTVSSLAESAGEQNHS